MSKVEELIKQTKEYIKEDCMKEIISPIENDLLQNKLDSILAEYEKEKENIIDIFEKLPNANPSYWHTCDVIDRCDAIEIVKGEW